MKRIALTLMALLFFMRPLFAQDGLQEVVVGPGDTLWSIANKYLKDPQKWPEIVRVNNLPAADPTMALPGTKIRIPVSLIKEEYRTAKLILMEADVRYKHKNETDFKSATPDMILKYEDSLRTMQGSQARVKFPTQETIQINENSLVVLKPEKIIQEVQLMQGAVRASKAKVIMPGGTVVHPQGKNSEYQAKVRDDESEVVFVYKGEVNVTAQGKTVHVKQGFGTHVPKSAPPLEPTPLKDFSDFNPADMPSASAVQKAATTSAGHQIGPDRIAVRQGIGGKPREVGRLQEYAFELSCAACQRRSVPRHRRGKNRYHRRAVRSENAADPRRHVLYARGVPRHARRSRPVFGTEHGHQRHQSAGIKGVVSAGWPIVQRAGSLLRCDRPRTRSGLSDH